MPSWRTRSVSNTVRLPEPFAYFIDRSIGKNVVAEALRAEGETVHVHDDFFDKKTDDDVWLADVGSRGWIVLSKDARIRHNVLLRNALLAAEVAAFLLGRGNATGPQMATAFITALP